MENRLPWNLCTETRAQMLVHPSGASHMAGLSQTSLAIASIFCLTSLQQFLRRGHFFCDRSTDGFYGRTLSIHLCSFGTFCLRLLVVRLLPE